MFVRLFARSASVVALLFALSAIAVRPLQAQGGSLDIIVGTVTDAAGKPVVGAVVEAFSIETEVTKKQTTNEKGQYRIIFQDGTGQYRVSVKAIGKNPQIFNVARQSDDDRIVLNIKFSDKPVQLNDLVANANRRVNVDQLDGRLSAGEASRNMTGDQALRLPIDAGDLAALAALAPGVIVTGGGDSTAATFSVAGQSAASNTYVVNGITTSSSAVPQDAVRSTRVTTNAYDVAKGNFSGGMVSVTTKGGSNRVTGSLSGSFQNQDLAFGGSNAGTFGAGNTTEAFGAGFGGPLKRDRLFLFGSFNVSRNITPVPSLDLADAATLSRLGASSDSVNKFISLVNGLGLTSQAGTISPNRHRDAFSSIARFDWNAGLIHVISFTGQLQLNGTDPQSIGTTSLPQVGGSNTGNSASAGLRVSSRFDNGMINSFNGGYSWTENKGTPFLFLPSGRVTNYSYDSLGGTVPVTFGFGGNSGMPTQTNNKTVEITNELSMVSGTGAHRWALGLYGNRAEFTTDQTGNRFGSYTYATLGDFQTNTPSSFRRTLNPSVRQGSITNEAVYLSDAWRPRIGGGNNEAAGGRGGQGGDAGGGRGGRGGGGAGGFGGAPGGNGGGNLQLNYGLRLEHSSYTGAPDRNDAVYNQFTDVNGNKLDTHVLPSEVYISPRIGFSYSIAAPEQQGQAQRGFAPPLVTIRGGFGMFRGTMPGGLPGTAQAQSGLAGAQTQLYCTGNAVPLPNWTDYITHPEDIPTECKDNQSTPVITGKPNITTYDANYGASKTRRFSLGLTRRITQRIQFNVDASYVKGLGQAASRDYNLNETPRFTISNEANRPSFADPAQIFPTTGQVPLSASRKDINFGTVTQVFSALENSTKQITLNVSGSTNSQINMNLSYTLMAARDQGGSGGGGGGGGGSNITAGDPNVFEWATSSSQRRHNIQASIQWPITPALELASTISMQSGSPYTPIVSGDINGDGGSRNDRAFIFNPATTADTAVSNGISKLLESTSGNAKKCLQAQLGTIAERNSCVGPWRPSLNLQLNWRPALFNRRLALQFQAINTLGGLDELINGADNLKGWGGNVNVDNTLLTVKGFDAATSQFKYSVNSRFGNSSSSTQAIRSPFQIALKMQYAIGFDQRTQQLQNLGRNGVGGAMTGPAMLDSAMVRFKRFDIALNTIGRKDSLVLSKEQISSLQALADSTLLKVRRSIDSIRPDVEKVNLAGSAADLGGLMQKLGPFTAQMGAHQREEREAVQKILTDVQWALLPDSIKNPQMNLLGAGGRGGPGAAGGPGGAGGGARTGRGGGGE